jgi:hypothetical protein
MPDLTVPVQRIRAFVVDHVLEPDAMRGTEHYLRNIKDGDGNAIDPVDEEEARRQMQSDATISRAPIRVQSSSTMSSASETTPPAVPVSEAAPTSPNIQRAPLVATPTTPPVVNDPGVDWQAKARAEGWAPREDLDPRDNVTDFEPAPPTQAPVPNANPTFQGSVSPETAPPPTPASGEGTSQIAG